MSSLVKFVPLHLTPTDAVALQASKGKKIAMIAKSSAEKLLKSSIEMAFVIMGHKFEASQLIIFTDCLWDELKKSQSYFSLEEIDLALDFGAKGKLCDLSKIPQPVISLSNFLYFIRLYNEKIRREALSKDEEEKAKQEKFLDEKTQAERLKDFEHSIVTAYESFKDTYHMPELPMGVKASYCRYLYGKNFVELTASQESEIFNRAKKMIPTVEEIRGMNAVDRAFHQKKKSAQLQEVAESIALEYLFMEYMNNEIDLTKLI